MKKILLVALVSGLSAQVEAASNSVNFYAGVSAVGSWTSSDFKMDYDVNDTFSNNGAVPHASHKDNSIGRVGAGFAVGVKKKFENGFFVGGEFDYTLGRATHHHNFKYSEDIEVDALGNNNANDPISKINVKHGDELAFAVKFGKDCKSFDIYGILGVTTKDVEIGYSLDGDANWSTPENQFHISPKERVWGAVFGLGGSKKINDKISCSLEYKYKLYNSAKKDVDCRAETRKAFGGNPTDPIDYHDKSDRHFKVKSDKHEISLGITVNI